MNALKLFTYCSRNEKKNIVKTLCVEWLHGLIVAAPNGIILWLVWELLVQHTLPPSIWYWLVLLTVLFVIHFLSAPFVTGKTLQLGYRLTSKLRHLIAGHAYRLGLGFFGGQRLGNFADELHGAINKFEFALSHSITNLIAVITLPPILLGVLLVLNWKLGLVMLFSILIIVLLHYFIGRFLTNKEDKAAAKEKQFRNAFFHKMFALPLVKSYGSKKFWKHQHTKAGEDAEQSLTIVNMLAQPLGQMTYILLDIVFVLVLLLAAFIVERGEEHFVTLLLFALIGYRANEPVKVLLNDWLLLRQIDNQLAPAARLLKARAMQVYPHPDNTEPTTGKPKNFDIGCRGIEFSYVENRRVLGGVNLDCEQGKVTALVGKSGSGKTTLLQLIMRFYDPQQGSISIGGHNINSISERELNALFSPVFQKPYLFNGTLIDNVRFGKPGATEAELQNALKNSGCLSLAEHLPDGLDSNIGENGRFLSGGQQQLVAIARSFLKDAPIILFDEAVASLDSENSHAIMEAIEKLCHNKTVIAIAHTLSRLQHADKIVTIENGVIAESGTHQQLVNSEGLYSRLWHSQQQGKGWTLV